MPDNQMDDLLKESNAVQAAQPRAQPNQPLDQTGLYKAQGVGAELPSLPQFKSAEALATGGAGYQTPPASAATPKPPSAAVVSSALEPRPPTPIYGNADSQAVRAGINTSTIRGPIQSAVDGGLPSGVTRVGNSYSGVGSPDRRRRRCGLVVVRLMRCDLHGRVFG